MPVNLTNYVGNAGLESGGNAMRLVKYISGLFKPKNIDNSDNFYTIPEFTKWMKKAFLKK